MKGGQGIVFINQGKTQKKGSENMKRYRVHRLDIKMEKDQEKLEQFLNDMKGEVVSIIPHVTPKFSPGGMGAYVDFLLIVEKVAQF